MCLVLLDCVCARPESRRHTHIGSLLCCAFFSSPPALMFNKHLECLLLLHIYIWTWLFCEAKPHEKVPDHSSETPSLTCEWLHRNRECESEPSHFPSLLCGSMWLMDGDVAQKNNKKDIYITASMCINPPPPPSEQPLLTNSHCKLRVLSKNKRWQNMKDLGNIKKYYNIVIVFRYFKVYIN